ncbi:MAG: class I SAM-dependent methyltransferase [Myxococcota bacterium]|nr:class I SAM-dependent methyltransferase [Myxococcota bacterium]
MPKLTASLIADLPKSGLTDPVEFYRRPLVGILFRERINMGLRLLGDRRFDRLLEVGFGAGAVLLALSPTTRELFGIDLDADPEAAKASLERKGVRADLRRGSVYELPYDSGSFDLVVSFSVFEHLHEYSRALGEVARVLRSGGLFLLGMPAVNRAMGVGFRAIGFKNIEDHHVTTPSAVAAGFADAGFAVVGEDRLGLPKLRVATLYFTWLLQKKSP